MKLNLPGGLHFLIVGFIWPILPFLLGLYLPSKIAIPAFLFAIVAYFPLASWVGQVLPSQISVKFYKHVLPVITVLP